MSQKEYISNVLLEIIDEISSKKINKSEASLFSLEYGFTPDQLAYILIVASEKLNFQINTAFVDSLENCSFSQLVDSILMFTKT